ncbi:MAG: hypothetical protein JST88_09385 [Bacteroidetes bacterium]|nr:hypothetical protein [Bacteroidota bacterium]
MNRYKLFTVWEADCWYQLKYQSGQVAHLEFMLNDKFDKAQKRIFISGGVILSRLYLYLDSELQPMWTYRDVEQMPLWMYSDAELAAGYGADFVIHVPFGLVAQDDTVQAFADRYKRDGKSYDYVKF